MIVRCFATIAMLLAGTGSVATPALGHDIPGYLSDAYNLQRRQQQVIVNAGLGNEEPAAQAAVDSSYIWTQQVLKVCFGPPDAVQAMPGLPQRIAAVAQEWTAETTLKLDFGGPGGRTCLPGNHSDIRINLNPVKNDFISMIGNASAGFSLPDHAGYSMSLSFSDAPQFRFILNTEAIFRFYVLHEFGHALGFVHEHQRIDCGFDVDYLKQFHNPPYTTEFITTQLSYLAKYDLSAYPAVNGVAVSGNAIGTAFDRTSIMEYNDADSATYKQGTASPCYRANWVSTLSPLDKLAAKVIYGPNSRIWDSGGAAAPLNLSSKATAAVAAALRLH